MIWIIVIVLFCMIAWYNEDKKPTKVYPTPQELEKNWHDKHGAWKDYGATTSIMGHVFVANNVGGYEYKGLVFATNSFTGQNCYWIHPGISITQDDFLARLDRL
jgi:hypothetical protein